MKKIFVLLLIGTILVNGGASAQDTEFEMRTLRNDYDYIAVQLRQVALVTGQPDAISTSDGRNDFTFAVRWPQNLGNVDIDVLCTTYDVIEGAARTPKETYYYQQFSSSVPALFPNNFTLGDWVTVATLKTTGATNTGAFELCPEGWAGNLMVNVDWDATTGNHEYFPVLVTGDCNDTPIPTLIYDLVWTGADAQYPTFWDIDGNWETTCGLDGSIPNTGNNCLIPVVSNGYYPAELGQVSGGFPARHQPFCDYLRVNVGASLSIDNQDLANSTQVLFTVNNDLLNYGTVSIVPDGQLTVTGDTYIDAAEGIVIQADANGVGSFINNGTISYDPSSGTAKVQTYLSNSAGTGNFDIHNIGPTVDEANYTGSGTGAFLSAFNFLPGDTWAYNWDETADLANGWVNIISLTDVILSAEGIGLSTSDNIPHILEMTGEFITGNVTNALTYSNNHYELISNPYPSSVDFDALATANSVVYNKYWIYNPAANNYVTRTVSSAGPGPQYVQVGQGMFVETISAAGTFTFTNTERAHSNDPFRSIISNKLTVVATGGQVGYKDEMVIRFDADATSGYDANIEAIKWNSLNADATMIRSITEEGTELAINVLPYVSLKSGITSVPMHFNCGYNTEYTISFLTMETFEQGTEIWLEDKQTGAEWINIFINPEYTFAASPNDPANRFVIHFFGPTSVDEHGVQNAIDIYGYRQFAYVRNNTTELIKDVQIYSLAGELLHRHKTVDTKLNKYWVSDKIGYYLVRVITNKNVYSGKVLITK